MHGNKIRLNSRQLIGDKKQSLCVCIHAFIYSRRCYFSAILMRRVHAYTVFGTTGSQIYGLRFQFRLCNIIRVVSQSVYRWKIQRNYPHQRCRLYTMWLTLLNCFPNNNTFIRYLFRDNKGRRVFCVSLF